MKSVQKAARDLREQFLDEKDNFYSLIKNHEASQILQIIKYNEKVKTIFRKYIYMTSPERPQNIQRLLIPAENKKSPEVITDRETIPSKLLNQSKKY